MEFEFDKEMDALLRQATRTGETTDGGAQSAHIDADEISIFAENALSEKSKPRVIKHLADCDRCRLILSNTIELNAEADDKAALIANPGGANEIASVTAIPWYKKLFATQNLAYGLGAMALIFAGMLGFLVIQKTFNSNSSEMAKASQDDPSSANTLTPSESPEPEAKVDSNSNLTATEDGNEADKKDAEDQTLSSNSDRQSKDADGVPVNGPRTENDTSGGDRDESNLKGNRRDTKPGKVVGRDKLKNKADEVLAEETARDVVLADDKSKPQPSPKRVAASEPAPPPAKPTSRAPSIRSGSGSGATVRKRKLGTTRANNRVAQESKKRAAEKEERRPKTSSGATTASDSYSASSTRRIGGKSFTRKGRVWYDANYKGQRTTNLRRKSAAYKELDSGLRSIADKLGGTVVVVWKSKAYRVD